MRAWPQLCAPRIFLVGQRDASDDLTVGRTDDVHDLAAMGFNERAIDVVCIDCCYRVSLHGCFHRVSPVENLSTRAFICDSFHALSASANRLLTIFIGAFGWR